MISYRLRIVEPREHLLEVEVSVSGPSVRLALPAWSPGSYLVRDYARTIRTIEAFDEETSALLPIEKLDKQTFEVRSGGARRVNVRYRVSAHELSVRTSHADTDHAFVHGPATFLYAVGREKEEIELRVEAPSEWEIATGLERRGDRFVARDYDELADSPIELAPHLRQAAFEVDRIAHSIAICGHSDGPVDTAELASDVRKIVERAREIFGGLPYPRYLFLLHLAAGAGQGGLEHRDSCALIASPMAFRPRAKYEELLELFAHEHFHAWNVKRIRPRALGPFDYSREAYTRALWIMEGVTSYYDRLLLVRAGLLPPRRYLEKLGEELARLRRVPGRFVQSLEESSFDAWIKFYKPDLSTPNTTVSYYLKGSLVAMALDLEIRRDSNGARSLDDVMRMLWHRSGASDQGFDESEVQQMFEEAAGRPLGDFFDAHVRGREELMLERWLADFGLVCTPKVGDPPEAAWLGVETRDLSGRAQVTVVLAGSPAAAAGVMGGDELIALDGLRLDDRSLRERLATRRAGETVRLALFRRDRLVELPVALAPRPPESYAIEPSAEADAKMRARYQAWLGEALP